jgi:glycerol-3-phosphate dehydrogenase
MKLRDTNLARLSGGDFDVVVVGGGINGAVSAACLAARGVKVALVDKGDFAGMTSQHSSNLAWGGIKYLETFELGLVRKLCLARNRLIRAYPSTVQPIGFYLTHERTFRKSRLVLWVGTWLYWLMGSAFLRPPRLLSTARMNAEEPIVDTARADGGIEYQDAYLHDNDARFVWNFVRGALDHGAAVANYVEVTGAAREGGRWELALRDVTTGRALTLGAKVVLNAAGPLVDALNATIAVKTEHRHALSKGIHLIVPRLTASKRVLSFFADDGRLFFVIPMGPRTCIGTTDTPSTSPDVHVTPEDRAFVLDNINARLRLPKPLTTSDIIAERCGVRPLAVTSRPSRDDGDWLQLSRKHVIEVRDGVVSIFGGKLTDCLNVGEEVFAEVIRLGVVARYPGRPWYGEPPAAVRDEFFHQARLMDLDARTATSSSEPLSTRLWRRYGSSAIGLLEAIRQDPRQADLVIENAEYIRCEIEEAARREMVTKLDDFLRRRSKIALVVPPDALRKAAGLKDAARILFGDDADARLAEHFGEAGPTSARLGLEVPVDEPREPRAEAG